MYLKIDLPDIKCKIFIKPSLSANLNKKKYYYGSIKLCKIKYIPMKKLLLLLPAILFVVLISCHEQKVSVPNPYSLTSPLPKAFPGANYWEYNGVLLAAEGEGLFTLAVSLKSGDKLIRKNVYNYVKRVGPMNTDGSYYEIEISDNDGKMSPEKIDALEEMIRDAEKWPAHQVEEAKQILHQYENVDVQKISSHVKIIFSEINSGEIIAQVESLSDSATVFIEFGSPLNGSVAYEITSDNYIQGKSTGLKDSTIHGYFYYKADLAPERSGVYINEEEMMAAMHGGNNESGNAMGFLEYRLKQNQSISFRAKISSLTEKKELNVNSEKIRKTLNSKRTSIDISEVNGVGEIGKALSAMRDAEALLITFNQEYKRRFIDLGYGGHRRRIHPGWDPAFDALVSSFINPQISIEHESSFFIGRSNFKAGDQQRNWGALHANAVWSLYQKFNNISLLEMAYPLLMDYYNVLKTMDVNGDGLLELFYKPGRWMGVDDGPMYDHVKQIGELSNLTGIDINFYYALTAERLSQISKALGKEAEYAAFQKDFNDIKLRINKSLWNEDIGIYLSKFINGDWNLTKTPMSFYPMICGIPDENMAHRMITDHLLNPNEFWGEYVIPSVSRDDPEFEGTDLYETFEDGADKSCYEEWRGTVWPPSNYLVYLGLKRYGFDYTASLFAKKSTDMWLSSWTNLNWFPEYFDAVPGRMINDVAANTAHRYQSWSMAMPLTGVQELIEVEPWGELNNLRFGSFGNYGFNEIKNVKFRNKVYDVSTDSVNTVLYEDRKAIFSSSGGRIVVRDFNYENLTCSFSIKAENNVDITLFPPVVQKKTSFHVLQGKSSVKIINRKPKILLLKEEYKI